MSGSSPVGLHADYCHAYLGKSGRSGVIAPVNSGLQAILGCLMGVKTNDPAQNSPVLIMLFCQTCIGRNEKKVKKRSAYQCGVSCECVLSPIMLF